MYVPKHFEENHSDALHGLIRDWPLATVVALTASGLSANHLPLIFDPVPGSLGILRGHVARGNPMWREYDKSRDGLAIFTNPGVYVTPSWYPSKEAHGRVVPTWNYVAVHAVGPLSFFDDHVWLRKHLHNLVATHETPLAKPWSIEDAPSDYISKNLSAIVGMELVITSLSGKWKVSQNRNETDRQGVIDGLRAKDDPVSQCMAER